MDYGSMSTPELQQECRRRGLPSGRVKADLVARLTEHDEGSADDDFDDMPAVTAAPDADLLADVVLQDTVPSAPGRTGSTPGAEPAGARLPAPPANPVMPQTVFRTSFPAGIEGPSEEAHLRYRATTIAAAAAAGHTTLGDAYRTGTVNGRELYEVNIRWRS